MLRSKEESDFEKWKTANVGTPSYLPPELLTLRPGQAYDAKQARMRGVNDHALGPLASGSLPAALPAATSHPPRRMRTQRIVQLLPCCVSACRAIVRLSRCTL